MHFMSNDRSNSAAQRSWLDRLSNVLSGEPQDKESLIDLLRTAEHRGLLDPDALAMIEGVLQVSELRVRDIMVPRAQMVVVERDVPVLDNLTKITESGHSRFPVIGDSRDDIMGILLAKDLLPHVMGNNVQVNIRDILRPAVFIPESKRLNVLLKEFRANRNHMAIVVDEYGGVSGLVSIEDVIEQIVGDIADEHDIDDAVFIKDHGGSRYTLKALTPVEDFNEYFQSSFDEEEFDTIGGVVVNRIGHLPKPGESVTIDRFNFKVLHADSRRVHLLQMSLAPSSTVETAPAHPSVVD